MTNDNGPPKPAFTVSIWRGPDGAFQHGTFNIDPAGIPPRDMRRMAEDLVAMANSIDGKVNDLAPARDMVAARFTVLADGDLRITLLKVACHAQNVGWFGRVLDAVKLDLQQRLRKMRNDALVPLDRL